MLNRSSTFKIYKRNPIEDILMECLLYVSYITNKNMIWIQISNNICLYWGRKIHTKLFLFTLNWKFEKIFYNYSKHALQQNPKECESI